MADGPRTYDDIPPSAFDASARLAFMDVEGIHAQVLYPNVGGFGIGLLPAPRRPRARHPVRAGLQRLPHRLVQGRPGPADRDHVRALWDVDLAHRRTPPLRRKGHRAINFCNQPRTRTASHRSPTRTGTRSGRPPRGGLPVNFHVGGGEMGTLSSSTRIRTEWKTNFAKVSSLIFMDNMRSVADLIFGGVCHRFPELKFVSVESGSAGCRLPGDVRLAVGQGRRRPRRAPRIRPAAERVLPAPDLRLLLVRGRPARRHREVPGQHPLRDGLPASDVPAPRTSQHRDPHPASTATSAFQGLADDVDPRRVLHENAAKLQRLRREPSWWVEARMP